MIVERTEYKGQPVLVLKRTETDKYPFSFGLSKARLVIEGINEIRQFVAGAEDPAGNEANSKKPEKLLSDQVCTSCKEHIELRRIEALPETKLCSRCAKARDVGEQARQKEQEIKDAQAKAGIICPICKGRLIMKYGKSGAFKGCENYPKCEYTQPVVLGK